MIMSMNIIALIIGVLMGLWGFSGHTISWLFVVLHSSAFSDERGFYSLYDMADDEVSYRWYTDHNRKISKYADYLKLHNEARSSAYATFKETYDVLVKSFVTRVLPITLAPTVLFWSNWYFYLTGVLSVLIILAAYEVTRNGLRPGYYQRLVIFTTLSTYSKKKVKASQ